MNRSSISVASQELVAWLQPRTMPWRAMTIAVDGVDYSGKSTLSRFLAWQLGMPVIETDFALIQGGDKPKHDATLVNRLVSMRYEMNRPIIVEGVFVLRLLAEIDIVPEVLINVNSKSQPRPGSWPEAFREYREEFERTATPDYTYTW